MTERKQLKLFECTEKLLKCCKCGEYKPCSEFHKNNTTKRGYNTWCKVCNSKYQKKYHERYYKNNTKQIKQRNKQWREKNSEQRKQYLTSPYKSGDTTQALKDIKKYESYIIDKNGDVNFKCTYCGIYYKTTRREVKNRLGAINGKGSDGGESRFYCSDQCKQECPTYGQRWHEKGHKIATSREVQPELRQIVLLRDNYTCQKCAWHKDELDVGLHCHHIWPLNESPITSADIDECMTLCVDCHKWVHMNVAGCGYGEMRCSIE